MAETLAWHTRPIFITSTFRDMHAERDYLRTHVFLELEERLKARRTHLEPIDLRWGVETVSTDEEHAKEMLVLKVCLAEVERSRPFLIGLIGDRYGWIPPEERMVAAAEEAGFKQYVAGRSVTDLEINFGVLDSPDQKQRSFFYFRDPLPYDQMSPQLAAEYSDAHNPELTDAADKLVKLKQQIETALPDRVRHYQAKWDSANSEVTGLEAWGQQVLEDLWQELDSETTAYVDLAEVTWQSQERFALEQFIENRALGFVGRKESLKQAIECATSADPDQQTWGLGITGKPGTGKSAVFSELNRQLNDQDVLVLAHAAGISPSSTQIDQMLRRWIDELAQVLNIQDPISKNASADDIEEIFGNLLTQASTQQRIVVLIDALNQFEQTTRAKHLTWLPKPWSDNARLITTAIPGTETEALFAREGIRQHGLPLLDGIEAKDIAANICERYHRELNPEVLDLLLAKQTKDNQPAFGNPLWLNMAIEEINLLDADDFARADQDFTGTPEEKLHQLIVSTARELPTSVTQLYDWMLMRAEQLFGEGWVQAFVSLITVSRSGWREKDFESLIPALISEPWSGLTFAALRRTFRSHISLKGASGQWDFTHAQMRVAIEHRYLKKVQDKKQLHSLIAGYLHDQWEEDAIALHESPYHVTEAEKFDELVEILGNILFIEMRFREGQHILYASDCHHGSVTSIESRPDVSQLLDALAEVCLKNAHILNARPELTYQQIYNHIDRTSERTRRLLEGWRHDRELNKIFWLELAQGWGNKSLMEIAISRPTAAAFSEDGITLLVGDEAGQVSCFSLSDGRMLATYPLLSEPVMWLSPLQNEGIGANSEHEVVIVESGDPGRTKRIRLETVIHSILFNFDDSSALILNSDGGVQMVHANGRLETVVAIHDGMPSRSLICLGKIADRFVGAGIAYDDRVFISNLDQSDAIASDSRTPIYAGRLSRAGITFSEDGDLVAVASTDGRILVLDSTNGTVINEFKGSLRRKICPRISPASELVAGLDSDGSFNIWALNTGEQVDSFSIDLIDNSERVPNFCFSPSGDRVALVGVNVIVRPISPEVQSYTAGNKITALATDGKSVAAGLENGSVQILNSHDGGIINTLTGAHDGTVTGCSYVPGGSFFVTVGMDGWTKIWDLSSGYSSFSDRLHKSKIQGLVVDMNGTLLTTVGNDCRIVVTKIKVHALENEPYNRRTAGRWNDTGDPVFNLESQATSCRMSPDGQKLAVTTRAGKIHIFSLTQFCHESSMEDCGAGLVDCAWLRNGDLIAAGDDGTIWRYGMSAKEMSSNLIFVIDDTIQQLETLGNRKLIVVVSEKLGIGIYNPDLGKQIGSWVPQNSRPVACANSDGSKLWIGDSSGDLVGLHPLGKLTCFHSDFSTG